MSYNDDEELKIGEFEEGAEDDELDGDLFDDPLLDEDFADPLEEEDGDDEPLDGIANLDGAEF